MPTKPSADLHAALGIENQVAIVMGAMSGIAHAVLFLASNLSDHMTGTTVYVDDGMTLYPDFRGAG